MVRKSEFASPKKSPAALKIRGAAADKKYTAAEERRAASDKNYAAAEKRRAASGDKQAAHKKRYAALALLEFETVATGILASDLMVKRAPIALLRCGTIHPGRYLVLVGGSVASTEEAYLVGVGLGKTEGMLNGSVFLGDVHPMLHDAVLGERLDVVGDALAVVETRSSPALLSAVDAAIKSTPVVLTEVRLADDLGGHAIALLSGDLTDTETALSICTDRAGDQLLARTLLPRLDPNLRALLDQGTGFMQCPAFEPAGAEHPEEVASSWAV